MNIVTPGAAQKRRAGRPLAQILEHTTATPARWLLKGNEREATCHRGQLKSTVSSVSGHKDLSARLCLEDVSRHLSIMSMAEQSDQFARLRW